MRDEINAWHVVGIFNVKVAIDAFLSASIKGTLEYMKIVEVLHCFSAEIYAELLEAILDGIVLKAEHIHDADEAIIGLFHGRVQDTHRFAVFRTTSCTACRVNVM